MEDANGYELSRCPELSVDLQESILAKALYINQEGTAFTSLAHSSVSNNPETSLEMRVASVFEHGVLNSNWINSLSKREYPPIPNKDQRGEIYFNIVGKMVSPINDYSVVTKISESPYIKNVEEALVVIFDLESFKGELDENYALAKEELQSDPSMNENRGNYLKPSGSRRYSYNGNLKSWLWRASNRDYVKNVLPSETGLDLSRADEEYGFALSHRIPPRLFKGLVLKSNNIERLLAEVVNLMREKLTIENYIPIYDLDGNMLWPKKMSHEELSV